ncbi:NUDIX hydrolase [Celerinatantimonas diazotrophica]|uniref:ADP-ribose pyrophosphatase YjhB (NUDIX family) n=1 Tax=Celerinatantimonas diazotrophica TaxID=412034 RepID=A0A4R1K1I9_9GAMM|nr:NUDIX hydrolase [Celerinatantimonas diazotrophica]TCK57858.1 ADP-ribose pyrophosphatase YjhB (NUDIX family) [Celerinatantimonas diazotrophica]CAG9298077.1 hypothetical protein CEDIAZO_03272 [Celerinatantimonas diazotrophica]
MISYQFGQNKFNFRAAAIMIEREHLLIQREADDDFWSLPGGRVELFEDSQSTIHREVREELGWENDVGPLCFYVENFFTFKGVHYHELSTYFQVNLLSPPEFIPEHDFNGIEQEVDVVFRWVAIEDLGSYNLKPSFLMTRLMHPLPLAGAEYQIEQESAPGSTDK